MKLEIYPKCPKPDWLKVGVTCCCYGEGSERFKVDSIDEYNYRVWLVTVDGKYDQGWESFGKLFR